MASKIFVGNIDYRTTREALQTLFGEVGPTRDVFLPNDRETGRPRGFAFVEFENEEDAKKAIERFNGYELDGRALRVNAAEERPRRPRTPGMGAGGARPSRDFTPDFGGGDYPSDRDFGYGGGGYGGGGGGGGGKAKGSRRNMRAKKRSL